MIKVIIFDCWGTLFVHDFKNSDPFSKFANKIGKNIHDYNFLKIFEEHFMLKKHFNLEIPIKSFLKHLKINFDEILIQDLKKILKETLSSQKSFPETFKVLSELKKTYKLGLISNTFYQSFQGLENKFKLGDIFDVFIKSYEINFLKPNPKIFEMIIKKFKCNKEEILMVGDSLKDDIQAAENFGIRGVLIDRANKYLEQINRISSLEQIFSFIN